MDNLNPPYGGKLVNLMLSPEEVERVKPQAMDAPAVTLTGQQLCDLDLLLNGAFSPLEGYQEAEEYDSVLEGMRLRDGTLWPLPLVLALPGPVAGKLPEGGMISLRDPEGALLAVVEEARIWQADPRAEAERIFGTTELSHPGVAALLSVPGMCYVGGRVLGLQAPHFYDFVPLRHSPAELRDAFRRFGWRKIAAYHTVLPLHRAQRELTAKEASRVGANLLLNPAVGNLEAGDSLRYVRARCYQAVCNYYPPQMAMLSLLNLATRSAGPREALLHAIIRKNMGCSHFFVGPNHADPESDGAASAYHRPEEAQELAVQYEQEIGIKMIPYEEMVYVPSRAQFESAKQVPKNEATGLLTRRELHRRMREGLEVPEWFSYPDVLRELRKAYVPKNEQGFTLFFTGLPGAGKSTVAKVLQSKFLEIGGRPVTLLDGDIVRRNLSSELGFSKEHRDLNIIRLGFVANEITKNGGIAICAPIAPYAATRRIARDLITRHGGFVEVHVSTPLEVCEGRDPKGLYAKARAGIVKEFTGVSDPYELPENAEITLDTSKISQEEAAQEILLYLEREGYLV